jgi:hypothetical protein
MRKLGIPELAFPDSIYRVGLMPGDIIIAGSDGRDDILINLPESMQKVMNEDENLFLRIAEEADGSLDEIVKRISLYGEITDDLSLIRIEYNHSEAD